MPYGHYVDYLKNYFEFDVRNFDQWLQYGPGARGRLPPLWMRTPAPNTRQSTISAHFRVLHPLFNFHAARSNFKKAFYTARSNFKKAHVKNL